MILQRMRAGIEGAVFGPTGERHQHLSVQTKTRNAVADAFFRFRRGSPDALAQLFERRALLAVEARQVFVNGFGFGSHGPGFWAERRASNAIGNPTRKACAINAGRNTRNVVGLNPIFESGMTT